MENIHIITDQDDLSENTEMQLLSTEYKDGQLQIVEVRPFTKGDVNLEGEPSGSLALEGDEHTKYVQLNTGDKSMMQLGLLNLTLVSCDDGTESYRLVTSEGVADDNNEATVTCVLAPSDNEGNEESSQEAYVMVNGDQSSLVFLQSSLPGTEPETVAVVDDVTPAPEQPKKLTPAEILERAKALQKAKSMLTTRHGFKRGRKRKSDLPSPQELLSSPNFKLFLYSCKMCSFKCNAIKEMTAHKASEHSSSKWRSVGRGATVTLQCARCPYKGHTHSQLMRHVRDVHLVDSTNKVYLNTEEVAAADVLVCGACGFESACRQVFRAHIENEHGATTC